MPKKRKCQYRAAAVALGRPRNGHGQFASDGHTKTQPSKDTILVDLCVESAVGASPVDETDESDLLYHKRMLALAEYVEVDYDVADSDDEEDIEAVVVIPPSAPQAETTTMQTFLQRFRPAPRPILSSSEIRIIQLENKRKRQLEEAAETVHDIKNYFVPVRNGQLARVSGVDEPPDERDGDTGSESENDGDSESDDEFELEQIDRGLDGDLSLRQGLQLLLERGQNSKIVREHSEFESTQAASVTKYISYRIEGMGKMSASLKAANDHWIIKDTVGRTAKIKKLTWKSYKCMCIRVWAAYFLRHRYFPVSKQGKHPKTHSIIYDEDACVRLRLCVDEMKSLERTPQRFQTELNNRILRTIPRAPATVSEDTCRRWMIYLGYQPTDVSAKSCFVDGHERDDVVAHRLRFLDEMYELERRMEVYEGENMDVVVPPQLQAGEKRVVFVTHDESVFYSNDAKKVIWKKEGENELRPKSAGQSIMVSGFVCACHGFLCGMVDGKMVRSYTTMLPGTNRDGWWDNERLVAQINEVSPLFKAEHPDCELVFAFDNSCNHRAYADDALVANRMRKGDNTKTAKLMRDTYFINRHGERVEQSMRTDENKPKGIRRVLLERGLMGNRENLNFICSDCDHNILNGNARCCCVKILSSQPDFKNQKIWIEEVLDTYDIKVIFYPKFHCELNFIELMWSRLKATLRAECSFNFAELKLRLPNALETFSIPFTKKVLRHCLRYMQGYRRGLTGQLLRYAVKKYRGHRVLPGFTEEAIANQFDTYKEEKKSRKFRKLGR
jgi:hypothetical protein